MAERLVGEIAFDPKHTNKYLVVKRSQLPDQLSDQLSDGKDGIEIIYSGSSKLHFDFIFEAYSMVIDNPLYRAEYHFFEPLMEGTVRKGRMIGGLDE